MRCDSVSIMKYFFENLETNDERWNFIEEYFLGVDLMKKYNIETAVKSPAIEDIEIPF